MQYRLARASDRWAMRQVQIAANGRARKALFYQVEDFFGTTTLTRMREDPHRGSIPALAFVAEDRERVIGFSGWSCEKELGLANIKGNYVHPDYWGRGVSTELVARVMTVLRESGFPVLKVRTEESNEVARHIYEKAGFRVFAVAPNYALKSGGFPAAAEAAGVRRCVPSDSDALLAFLCRKAVHWGAWEPCLLEQAFGNIGTRNWRELAQMRVDSLLRGDAPDRTAVMDAGDGPAGLAAWDSPGEDGHARLSLLLVAERHEKRDTGKRLIESACRQMTDAEVVSCEILSGDEPSISALTAAGFRRVGAIAICVQR